MYVPQELKNRVASVSKRIGCDLEIVRCWQSDGGRKVLYANLRGSLNESKELHIELAGTLCAETDPERDEISLFLFVNGQRVGPLQEAFKYLMGFGFKPFTWDYTDEGFDGFETLDEETYSQPIDDSLRIQIGKSQQKGSQDSAR